MIRNVRKCYNKLNGVQIIYSSTNITTTSTSQLKLIFSKL